MFKLGIGFLHILVPAVGFDDIHNVMALFVVYVMADGLMGLSIGNGSVRYEVLSKRDCHMMLPS